MHSVVSSVSLCSYAVSLEGKSQANMLVVSVTTDCVSGTGFFNIWCKAPRVPLLGAGVISRISVFEKQEIKGKALARSCF